MTNVLSSTQRPALPAKRHVVPAESNILSRLIDEAEREQASPPSPAPQTRSPVAPPTPYGLD